MLDELRIRKFKAGVLALADQLGVDDAEMALLGLTLTASFVLTHEGDGPIVRARVHAQLDEALDEIQRLAAMMTTTEGGETVN